MDDFKNGQPPARLKDARIKISEPGKPTIVSDPVRQEFAEQPARGPADTASDFMGKRAEVAQGQDVALRFLGTEKIDGYECLKVEAKYKGQVVHYYLTDKNSFLW